MGDLKTVKIHPRIHKRLKMEAIRREVQICELAETLIREALDAIKAPALTSPQTTGLPEHLATKK